MRNRPDTLVLGGGGVLGRAWMTGVLAGIEDARDIDLHRSEYFLGTSAGAILSASLAAGHRLERPAEASPDPPTAQDSDASSQGLGAARRGLALTGELLRFGLIIVEPPAAFGRAAMLRVGGDGTDDRADLRERIDRLGALWDGRLRVVAVRRADGRRIVFGAPGAPRATVTEAVAASCAVPKMFAPVEIDGAAYVDGGVWSATSLDVAPARRGTEVLCLSPTASLHGPLTRAWRLISRAKTLVELAALRSTGCTVELVTPDASSAAAMGADLMDATREADALAAGYRQGLQEAGARRPRPNSFRPASRWSRHG